MLFYFHFLAADRRENIARTHADRDGFEPCLLCGRAIKAPARFTVVVDNDGLDALLLPSEQVAAGDYSSFAIGSECVRKHPELKPYVRKHKN